ncbi:hypothetical protein EML15_08305 [Corynebacterium sp. sy017]|uniref:hypothetical protein n=1 Tax=unclassified Corynebacterium TaxID=2624378 RepID=UPI0011865000|nr:MULTISPECIES: hypothetical protein [unclassified Corynebacterium]MBP3089144.1 hypothetical protein [Corynebacterium sp. sy017]TSD91456.1 hypothetical protein ELY17_08315 [Corynebacterium sp. SY003]
MVAKSQSHKAKVTAAALGVICALSLSSCSSHNVSNTPDASTSVQQATGYDTWDANVLGVDLNGQAVDMENADYAGHSPEDIQQITDYGENTEYLEIPEVGMNVPLGTMNSYNGVIEPVGFTHAYVVGDFSPGYHDPDNGSVMIVAHALDGAGMAPGNFVWDSATRQAKVHAGSEINVGGDAFTITAVEQIPKTEITDKEELWSQTPGTLFFVTCVPNAAENLIITATINQPQ